MECGIRPLSARDRQCQVAKLLVVIRLVTAFAAQNLRSGLEAEDLEQWRLLLMVNNIPLYRIRMIETGFDEMVEHSKDVLLCVLLNASLIARQDLLHFSVHYVERSSFVLT